MHGPSRQALQALREQADRVAADGQARLARDLFAVADELAASAALRRAASEPATPAAPKRALLRRLFGALGPDALGLLDGAAAQRWSTPRDLVDALDILATEATFATAEGAGELDEVEDELFRFGRIVAREPELALALTDPATPAAAKLALLDRLLQGRTRPASRTLLERAAIDPRGRSLERAVAELAQLAAARRQRLVADVRTAHQLSAEQAERLTSALGRIYGRTVQLQVAVVPELIGGMTVRVGDELVDGSVVHRLAQARSLLTR